MLDTTDSAEDVSGFGSVTVDGVAATTSAGLLSDTSIDCVDGDKVAEGRSAERLIADLDGFLREFSADEVATSNCTEDTDDSADRFSCDLLDLCTGRGVDVASAESCVAADDSASLGSDLEAFFCDLSAERAADKVGGGEV